MIKIPIIDLFAGPGGLGEGFSSIRNVNGDKAFDIKLSIEKEEYAHSTLRLRSFYRQFSEGAVPELYYDYIKENNLKKQNELLIKLKKEYGIQWEIAESEAWRFELPFPEEFDKTGKKRGGYTPDEILERNKEIDDRISKVLPTDKGFLLIGGPPCQAYSLVGRSRNQGMSNKDHRVHLYKEYIRIIARHHPAIFIMENVKGLLSAKVDGKKVFDLIKKDLRSPRKVYPEYNPPNYKIFSFVKEPDGFDSEGFPFYKNDMDFLIKTEIFGIPQRRHRVILLGIREDIGHGNIKHLINVEKEITLEQVIGSLPELRSGIGREICGTNEKGKNIYRNIRNSNANWTAAVLSYKMKLDSKLTEKCGDLLASDNQGSNYQKFQLNEKINPIYDNWYKDDRLDGVLNHESRTHLKEDLGRYLFSLLYLRGHGDFPRLKDYPDWLLPKHKNAMKGDKFTDRFRTQKPNQAATTVTSHIARDGHYFIHYDPRQCRSLTVREAARIQTFPDNYYFRGRRTHQYHQVGNAVPPLLANQIASIVFNIFQSKKE